MAIFSRPAAADGLPAARRLPPGLYAQPQGPPSCLMAAAQLGQQTGRRELAYAASEACALYAGSRGFVLPYGPAGPYVPGWVPPNWVLPR
jgi:hypothetical protein